MNILEGEVDKLLQNLHIYKVTGADGKSARQVFR